MTTRSSLYLVWPSPYDKTFDDVEKDGLAFLGHWPSGELPALDGGQLSRLWPPECVMDFKVRRWYEQQSVELELLIAKWPSAEVWRETLGRIMGAFVDEGAVVAWCGNERSSPWVSCLNPDITETPVYAAYTKDRRLVCLSGLDEQMRYLDDENLRSVWEEISPSLPRSGVS